MNDRIDFEDTVSFLLARVATAFRNKIERQMVSIGLHSGQAFVLLELWKEDGLKQIDLASRLGVSAPTINKMVKGLRTIGLVRMVENKKDRRSANVYLTDNGYRIREKIEAEWIDLESASLARLTETERMVLADLLRKLVKAYPRNESDAAPKDE